MFKSLFLALKGDFNGHPFRGNQWGKGGAASEFAAERNKRSSTVAHLLNAAFNGDKELLAEFHATVAAVDKDVEAGLESYRHNIKNLEALDSGKAKKPAYTDERLKLHNQIINSLLAGSSKYLPEEGKSPEVIFLGGRGGSGKGGFNKSKGYESGVYSDTSHLLLDPDKVKSMMPGYDPEKAYLVHRESTDIFDKLVSRARQRGLNVVLDITMRSPLTKLVKRFKEDGYSTQAHYMHLSPEGAVVRAVSRWATEREKLSDGSLSKRGRLVPPDVVLSMTNNERNFDAVSRIVDSWSLWANDRPRGEGPRNISKKSSAKKFEGFSVVLKANPYHDHLGRFTSHGKALSVSLWGKKNANIDASNNAGKNALATQHHLSKVKEMSHVLGKHVRAGGTLSDAFGKSVLAQASLHASGAKAYGTHIGSKISDSMRSSLDAAVSDAFAKSNLSVKEKTLAGIPLTEAESAALAKSKEYDKQHYSKKMKAQKLAEIPALMDAVNLAFHEQGGDSAAYKKAEAKLAKARMMAQKHGATDDDLFSVSMTHMENTKAKKELAKSGLVEEFHAAIKKMSLSGGNDNHLEDAMHDAMNNHKGLLTKDDITAIASAATVKFNEASQKARDHLSDTYSAYQPFKTDKSKGVTWDSLSSSLGIPKSQMKSAYDAYQAAYKKVVEEYGEVAATKAVKKGKELFAAKKLTGSTPVSEAVQLSAKSPANNLGEVLGGKAKDSSPAKTSDTPKVAKTPVQKAKTKEEAMDAAKALGLQYYLLKQGKYASTSNPAAQPELSAAHKLYQQAKEQYVSLGGKMDEFSSISSGLKKSASENIAAEKEKSKKAMDVHKAAVKDAAFALEQAKAVHKPGTKVLQAAFDKYNSVVVSASKHLTPGIIDTYAAAGKSNYHEVKAMAIDSAKTHIKSAASALQTAMLNHPKDKNHEDVLKAASNLNGLLKINSTILSKEEIAAAKTEGTQLAAANHKAAKVLSSMAGNAPKIAANYDKQAASFKNVTDDSDFISHGHAQVAKLKYQEKQAVSSYTGSAFTDINKQVGAFGTAKMKGLPTPVLGDYAKDKMLAMDSAFAKTTLGSNVKLRRNMPQKYFWEQLGFNLAKVKSMSDAELAALSGKVYKETAFSSTSTRPNFESCFSNEAKNTGSLALRIRASADMPGLHAKSISNHSGEDEVILPRGTTYVIRSIKRTPNSSHAFEVHVDMLGAFPDQL